MAVRTPPKGLSAGGRALWRSVAALVEADPDGGDLDPSQLVLLEEACRLKDRLDRLDRVVRTGGPFGRAGGPALIVDDAGRQANQTADTFKKLLAALRLPDPATGRRPQRRGPRGVQRPSVPGGKARRV